MGTPQKSEEKKPLLLSVPKMAEKLGYTSSNLYDKVKQGVLEYVYVNGKKYLDVEKSLAALKEYSNPSHQNQKNIEGSEAKPMRRDSFADAKTKREIATAKTKELEFKMLSGQVIDRKKVEKAAYECARITREQFLGIPDRIAVELAAEPDARKVHTILTNALTEALNTLAARITDFEGVEADADISESFEASAGEASDGDESEDE